MSCTKRLASRALVSLACGGAIAAGVAPSAQAGFSIARCTGDSTFARGSSFQTAAIAGFNTVLQSSDGCNRTDLSIGYDPAGSDAGRRALGAGGSANPSQQRDVTVRSAGTDQPPTDAERAQIENGPIDAAGQDVTDADDGKVHVIPAAIGAMAIMVNLPDTCADLGTAPVQAERPRLDNQELEDAFEGGATWGDVLPGLPAGPGCADQPVRRVVRRDSASATFALKQYLANIPNDGSTDTNWTGLANVAWPDEASVVRADADGAGSLRTKLASTDGGIGYADLATARGGGGEFTFNGAGEAGHWTFWVPLQVTSTATYADPQADAIGYRSTSTSRGANCASATSRTPLPASSFGDWTAVDYSYSPAGYGVCTLTYALAFDDNSTVYCNSAEEERRAMTVKNFLETAVSMAGQNSLPNNDYDRLPAEALANATAAVQSIDWKKSSDGRFCSAPPVVTAPPPPTTTTTPPPLVSNAFTVKSPRISGKKVRLSLRLPGAGRLSIAATAKPRKGKPVKLATKSVTVARAGTLRVTIALNAKAKRALARSGRLTLTMRIRFSPTGGKSRTISRKVTFKTKAKALGA